MTDKPIILYDYMLELDIVYDDCKLFYKGSHTIISHLISYRSKFCNEQNNTQ